MTAMIPKGLFDRVIPQLDDIIYLVAYRKQLNAAVKQPLPDDGELQLDRLFSLTVESASVHQAIVAWLVAHVDASDLTHALEKLNEETADPHDLIYTKLTESTDISISSYLAKQKEYADNPKGHVWVLDADGLPNLFALDYDPHHGVVCQVCGEGFCKNCDGMNFPPCQGGE